MTIRSIIILLTVPLFLAMAAVNGALLYFQEKAEMARALEDQALAAAVVAAEFVAEMDDPQAVLSQPLRRQAIDSASHQIVGLQGLYLIAADGAVLALMSDSAEWVPQDGAVQFAAPELGAQPEVQIIPAQESSAEPRFVAARASAGNGRFVAARIDAEPMFARIDRIKRAILVIIFGTSVFSAGLSWFVARRIGRELRINREALAAITQGGAALQHSDMQIRETRDLADAVHLMEASQSAAVASGRRITARQDQKRDLASALASSQSQLFAPVSAQAAGAAIAMRILGKPHAGAFFALAYGDDAASGVIGRCKGEDAAASLAMAFAARRFIEANLLSMGADQCLTLACEAFQIEEHCLATWRAGEPLDAGGQLLCIAAADEREAAQSYVAANAGATPDEWLDGIDVFLAPDGVFVAVAASRSA